MAATSSPKRTLDRAISLKARYIAYTFAGQGGMEARPAGKSRLISLAAGKRTRGWSVCSHDNR